METAACQKCPPTLPHTDQRGPGSPLTDGDKCRAKGKRGCFAFGKHLQGDIDFKRSEV